MRRTGGGRGGRRKSWEIRMKGKKDVVSEEPESAKPLSHSLSLSLFLSFFSLWFNLVVVVVDLFFLFYPSVFMLTKKRIHTRYTIKRHRSVGSHHFCFSSCIALRPCLQCIWALKQVEWKTHRELRWTSGGVLQVRMEGCWILIKKEKKKHRDAGNTSTRWVECPDLARFHIQCDMCRLHWG